MRLLLLARFGRVGASSRMRSYQYQPWFESAGIECTLSPFFSDDMLVRKYKAGSYGVVKLLGAYWQRCKRLMSARQFDLVWIEKEALPWWPNWVERWLLRDVPYVIDLDDAIFHNYDLHRSALVRRVFGRRLDRLLKSAKLVVAGNAYLEARAVAAGAQRVELVPTVIDLARYSPRLAYPVTDTPRVVWIGSPSTLQYLRACAVPLMDLAQRIPFTLRVIGGGNLILPGVDVEPVLWALGTETVRIAECEVGIMPLSDSPWEQGKCAYKLIQYMAAGLPTVSSPIGANLHVVVEGKTGLFANTPEEWIDQLEVLLRDAALRKRLGEAGRSRVEAEFCLQVTAPLLAQLLKEAAEA